MSSRFLLPLLALAAWLLVRRRRVYVTATGLRVLAATADEMAHWERVYREEFEDD